MNISTQFAVPIETFPSTLPFPSIHFTHNISVTLSLSHSLSVSHSLCLCLCLCLCLSQRQFPSSSAARAPELGERKSRRHRRDTCSCRAGRQRKRETETEGQTDRQRVLCRPLGYAVLVKDDEAEGKLCATYEARDRQRERENRIRESSPCILVSF